MLNHNRLLGMCGACRIIAKLLTSSFVVARVRSISCAINVIQVVSAHSCVAIIAINYCVGSQLQEVLGEV